MQEFLDHLVLAHAQIKAVAIAAIQNDQDVEQHVIDGIKAVYELIRSVKQANGL